MRKRLRNGFPGGNDPGARSFALGGGTWHCPPHRCMNTTHMNLQRGTTRLSQTAPIDYSRLGYRSGLIQAEQGNDPSMKVLVTGSSGHLGETLVRTMRDLRHEVVGIDIVESRFTSQVGSISDRSWVRRCMRGVQAVFHSATLHKPHVATRSRQDFVDTNISSTLNLLEEAVTTRVESFVYTTNVLVTFLCRQRELRQHGSRRRLRLFPRTSMA